MRASGGARRHPTNDFVVGAGSTYYQYACARVRRQASTIRTPYPARY
jgi:hypothetical protein